METSEQLLKKVGSFKLYQKRTLFVVYLISFLTGIPLVICNIFIVYTPPHRCYISEIDDNSNFNELQQELPELPRSIDFNSSLSSPSMELAQFIPIEIGVDGTPHWSRCSRYTNQSLYGTENAANRTTMKCTDGWKYFVPPGLSSATTEYDLVCDKALLAPTASSLLVFGFIFGSIGGGYISDRFGRQFTFYFFWIAMILGYFAVSLLPIWEATYPFWFLIGFGFIGKSIATIVIINEQTPVNKRYTCCFINMLACAASYMTTPLLNYLVQQWRYYLLLLTGLQSLSLIPMFFFLRESLQWLLQNKKYEKAKNLLKQIGNVNKNNFQWDINLSSDENSSKEEPTEIKKKKPNNPSLSYIDLVRITFLRKRVLILAVAWIATTANYYGLSMNTNGLGGNRYIACLLAGIVEIPGYCLCYLGLRKVGGRLTFLCMIGLSGFSLFFSALLLQINQIALIIGSMIGKLFASGSFAVLYILVGDFFPTLLRNQSYGASSFPSRLTSLLIPYLIYAGDHYFKSLPYLVMGSTAIAAALGMFFLPETRNTSLPDTLEDAKQQDGSPCRAVWTTLRALNLEFEPVYIDLLKGEQRKPEYFEINPRGKVPAIKEGDFCLSESRAVSSYLCNKYEEGNDEERLYPVDYKARGLVDQMLYVSENIQDMVQKYLNTGGVLFRKETTNHDSISEVHKALKLTEGYFRGCEYIAGNHVTIAVDYSDFNDYPKTSAWVQKIKALPYFEECNKVGLESLKNMYQKALKKLQPDDDIVDEGKGSKEGIANGGVEATKTAGETSDSTKGRGAPSESVSSISDAEVNRSKKSEVKMKSATQSKANVVDDKTTIGEISDTNMAAQEGEANPNREVSQTSVKKDESNAAIDESNNPRKASEGSKASEAGVTSKASAPTLE